MQDVTGISNKIIFVKTLISIEGGGGGGGCKENKIILRHKFERDISSV